VSGIGLAILGAKRAIAITLEKDMSYGFTPIAVDLDLVRKAIGTKDASLLAALLAEYRHDDPEVEEDEEVVSAREALKQMVMGEKYSEGENVGSEYGYALECLCLHFGEQLNDDQWCSMHMEWVETVDAALEAEGATGFSVLGTLMHRGAPITIPPTYDFPGIGYMLAGEMGAVLGSLLQARQKISDEGVRESVGQVCGWIETCIAEKCDLVCFYY
jgi:hypothetical protein